MMEQIFKIVTSVILIIMLVNLAVPLINNYSHYTKINSFANDIKTMIKKMDSLASINSYGSFLRTKINVPQGYELVFNNYTDELMISGAEVFNMSLKRDLLNYLELGPGTHEIELYYGNLSYDELKERLVTFK